MIAEEISRNGAKDAKPQLADGWRWVKLGKVCEIQLGKMLSPKSKVGKHPRSYLRNANVQWGRFDLAHVSLMDFTETEARKFELRKGDLLVCEGGEPGRAAVWNEEIKPCYYQKALHRLRPIGGLIDPSFVMWRMWLGANAAEFSGSHAKTTIAHLPAIRLAQLPIQLPPLAEQKRIAGILKEQMAAVERARSSAVAQLQAAESLPAAHLRAVFNSPEAQAWPKKRLGDVLELRQEVVHPYDKPKGAATFVGLEHIQSGTGVRTGSVALEMSELTGRKPRFYKGDIVYGYLRPYLNKVWLAEFDGLCSVDQYVYKVDATKADTTFVSSFMRSPVYLQRTPGLTQSQLPRIRTEEVAAVELNFPPLRDQRRIAAQLSAQMASAERLRQTLAEQLDAINHLPAALLRRAFSGEL